MVKKKDIAAALGAWRRRNVDDTQRLLRQPPPRDRTEAIIEHAMRAGARHGADAMAANFVAGAAALIKAHNMPAEQAVDMALRCAVAMWRVTLLAGDLTDAALREGAPVEFQGDEAAHVECLMRQRQRAVEDAPLLARELWTDAAASA